MKTQSSGFDEVEIAPVRDYLNARPCNLRHSTAPVGTKQYFDEVETRKYFVQPYIPGLAPLEKWNGKRVLEIGSGLVGPRHKGSIDFSCRR